MEVKHIQVTKYYKSEHVDKNSLPITSSWLYMKGREPEVHREY